MTEVGTAPRRLVLTVLLIAAATLVFTGRSDGSARDLSPHPVEGGVLFSYQAPGGTRSVHLAGDFDGWSMTSTPMADDDGDGVYRIVYPLEVGRRYEYKFVVDGTEWVTDPNAPEVNRRNFNNGVFTYLPLGVPYAVLIHPADGSRSTALPSVSARLDVFRDKIDPLSVQVTLNGEPLDSDFDPSSGNITAALPEGLPDGEYRLAFSARATNSHERGETAVSFNLDRTPPAFDSPDFYDGAIVYEIFVRSFCDSDGDGVGDLNGLTAKLDYLNDGDPSTDADLGIDVIWMMPVCESPSYHGYDVTDYYRIEQDYGANEDFFRLCREAHKRGVRVVFDYVVNHCSNQSAIFRDAYGNPGSKYSSWFHFIDKAQTRYEGFAGIESMPTLNFDSREMRDYITRMGFYWMDPDGDGDFAEGVDGFRCDVAKGPPHNWWKELRTRTKSLREDFLVFGETWDGSPDVVNEYFDEEFDMQFDYPLYYKFLDLLNQGAVDDFDWMLEEERTVFPPQSQLCRFLDNHDNDRTLSALGGDVNLNRLGALVLLTLPGTPMLYYGEEIGMLGDKPPDQNVRRFMEWDRVESQWKDPASLLSWHRQLIHLRKRYPALTARHGADTISYRRLETDNPRLYAYLRSSADAIPILVLCNLSGFPADHSRLTLESSDLAEGAYRLREIFPKTKDLHRVKVHEGGRLEMALPVELEAKAGAVICLERQP